MNPGELSKSAAASEGSEERSSKRRKISHPSPRTPLEARKDGRTKNQRKSTPSVQIKPRPPRERRQRDQTTKRSTRTKTASANPTSDTSSSTTARLATAKSLLDNLFARHKNQHRTQSWWTSLSTLRRALARVVAFEEEELSLRHHGPVSGAAAALSSAKEVRARFEREAQVRREKEVWNEWIREVLIPRAYVAFTGLVGDTQFANLGVALVGVLADVVAAVGLPVKVDEGDRVSLKEDVRGGGKAGTEKARTLTATSRMVTGRMSGELVERVYNSDDLGEVVERKGKAGIPSSMITASKAEKVSRHDGRHSSIPSTNASAKVNVPSGDQDKDRRRDESIDVPMVDTDEKDVFTTGISASADDTQETTTTQDHPDTHPSDDNGHGHDDDDYDTSIHDPLLTEKQAPTIPQSANPNPNPNPKPKPKHKSKLQTQSQPQPQLQSRLKLPPEEKEKANVPDRKGTMEKSKSAKSMSKSEEKAKAQAQAKPKEKTKEKERAKDKGKGKPKGRGKGNAIDDLFAGFT